MPRRARVLGVPIDALDMEATVRMLVDRAGGGPPVAHLGVNAANLVAARDDAAYHADLEAADVVTADGQPVVWAGRLVGVPIPERVAGIDLMSRLLDAARARRWGIYLLGARAPVVASLADRLREDGLQVVGFRDGYLSPEEWPAAAADVVASGAHVLFVGMPSPAKERFIIGTARPAAVPISVGVGGSFDVLSGQVRRAPRWMQRVGLEWLFRLVQEPRRLAKRYAVTNVRFAWLVLASVIRRRRAGSSR